ncbi:protein ARABIDILLO 1-like [Solanum tuberosum]|uniref:protein ARABIDILLO 1-like n=1 Tax=Solanum tuberosum TaxID=4113 RepID=UPI0003D2459E|nr:PREDICTED: protein ARABIDILLO 1-like [Solanum tuberosum]
MSRRIRRKLTRRGQEKVDCPEVDECLTLDERGIVDWTKLPNDTVIQLFSCLNYRDRASLSSTCRTWRNLGVSPCLWQGLDLRPHKCDSAAAVSLAPRCRNLQKLRFRGAESADAIIQLQAKSLIEISGDYCRKITDATLSVIAARHESLESLQLGPDFCERISSDAIKAIAICCPQLQRLRLSGIREVDGDAINALARHCHGLVDIGLIDCLNIDEVALGNVLSLRFLSVAGTTNMKWSLALQNWSKLPNLTGLDVSRTDIIPNAALRLFSSSPCLKILCALYCPALEQDANFVSNNNHRGKLLLSFFTDIFKEVASLFADTTNKERNVFVEWRNLKTKGRKVDSVMNWLEWILSHSLLRIAESNPQGLDNFWLSQGAYLLLCLMRSTQEEVQERAATGLATFVVIDDENASIHGGRAEAVMRDGGIGLLLNLARSWREGLQTEAAKAIANLSVNANVAKAVAEEGGISVLAILAKSMNRLAAEEAAGGLWNLSVGEEHKAAIAEAGGVKALVDLIFKWSITGGEGVLERAAGALANLAADDKCSMEVATVGGVHALVKLAQDCKAEGVQEQAARALANLAAHGDSNSNNAAVGQEAGALEALVQLIRSPHDGVRQEAAGALWNLSFDDRNREAIAAAGGVEALVALAQSCSNASPGLQERAAGALWGLSVSEANSIAIGREGGVAPLIALARSDVEDVHETAAGALWNLAFNPGNAFRIVEEGGVPALVHLCSSSISKMARFMAALALAYMFDGRMDGVALVGTSSESNSKSVNLDGARRMALKNIEAFILAFSDPQAFSAAAASSVPAALTQVTESARIHEAGHLRCSGAEIGRFVTMLRNSSSILKACAAFALLQFTIPGGRHAQHHVRLLQNTGASRILRAAAAAATAPIEAKIFARIVLRNLEHHQIESST